MNTRPASTFAPATPMTPAAAAAAATAARPPVPGALDGRATAVMTLLCLTWALQQISLKAVAELASPMLMVAFRSIVAGLLLALLMHRRGEGLARSRWGAGALVGTLFGAEFLLVSEALRLTHASHVVVFLYTAPIFAALGLQWRLPAERLGLVPWIGIAIAFAGIGLAFLGGDRGGAAAAVEGPALLGDALALLAGIAWGATTVAIRCSSMSAAPAGETLLYQLIGAVALLLPAAALSGRWHFDTSSALVWAHLGFHSLVVSFASFLAWFWLLRRYLASQLGVFSFLTPLFGVLLGAWLLGESLEPAFVAGSGCVLAGIALVGGQAPVTRLIGRLGKR